MTAYESDKYRQAHMPASILLYLLVLQ